MKFFGDYKHSKNLIYLKGPYFVGFKNRVVPKVLQALGII